MCYKWQIPLLKQVAGLFPSSMIWYQNNAKLFLKYSETQIHSFCVAAMNLKTKPRKFNAEISDLGSLKLYVK